MSAAPRDGEPRVTAEEIEALHARLDTEAEASGYHLNPDREFTRDLVRGLLINEKRYGYWACPCRLADGEKAADLDVICPCDYRDPDLQDHGMCYCALYVSGRVLRGEVSPGPIPERRPPAEERLGAVADDGPAAGDEGARDAQAPLAASGRSPATPLSHPVWRCRVCGYLAARERPPLVCPICKAKQERFERFL